MTYWIFFKLARVAVNQSHFSWNCCKLPHETWKFGWCKSWHFQLHNQVGKGRSGAPRALVLCRSISISSGVANNGRLTTPTDPRNFLWRGKVYRRNRSHPILWPLKFTNFMLKTSHRLQSLARYPRKPTILLEQCAIYEVDTGEA